MPPLLLVTSLALIAADPKPVEPFNGKDLTGWKLKGDESRSHWGVNWVMLDRDDPSQLSWSFVLTTPEPQPKSLVNRKAAGVDIFTEQRFGDCTVELEFMVPKGSNSGIYLMGEYEVQVFDSFGKDKLGMGDLGAIYGAAAPKVNAARKPGEWQKFVIAFQAPRFDAAGAKTANAKFLKVVLNDTVLHENLEVPGPTLSSLTGKEAPTGPLMLQGDHGPVAYRNIRITPGLK